MSDPLTSRLGLLRNQRPPREFEAPEVVRQRGRARHRRSVVAASTAVLALIGGGTGVGLALASERRGTIDVAPPTPVPVTSTPAPVSSPPPTSVPPQPSPVVTGDAANLFLRASDLGPGWRQREKEPEIFEGQDPWYFSEACEDYRRTDYPSLDHLLTADAEGFDGPAPSHHLVEIVTRYAAGWASRSVADGRAVVARCGTASPPPGVAPTRRTIVDSGFAGDESVLVKVEQWYYDGEKIASQPLVTFVCVVRVGDRVATLVISGESGLDPRTVASRAVQRLQA